MVLRKMRYNISAFKVDHESGIGIIIIDERVICLVVQNLPILNFPALTPASSQKVTFFCNPLVSRMNVILTVSTVNV